MMRPRRVRSPSAPGSSAVRCFTKKAEASRPVALRGRADVANDLALFQKSLLFEYLP